MLKPYLDSNFKLLQTWVTDESLLLQFSGTDFTFPITKKQITDYQNKNPDRRFYVGFTEDNLPFAFGEIIPQVTKIPRLGRILVGDQNLRGKGLGKKFIGMLLQECALKFHCIKVELLVWDKNYQAIKCYQSVGFSYDSSKHLTLVHKENTYHIHKMTYQF